jgi:hypothetical protein
MSTKIELMRQNALHGRRAVDALLLNYVKARTEQHRHEIMKASPDELIQDSPATENGSDYK